MGSWEVAVNVAAATADTWGALSGLGRNLETAKASLRISEDAKGQLAPWKIPILWCHENKKAILKIHSSKTRTKVFTSQCTACDRYFRSCMFLPEYRQSENPQCRWCWAGNLEDMEKDDAGRFLVNRHIHCGINGKTCGERKLSLITPREYPWLKGAQGSAQRR